MIQIKAKKDCCGCSACVSVCPKYCIAMHEDEEGFLYPTVDESVCIDCGLCEKVCPELHPLEAKRPSKVYAAINPDEVVRSQSSSGGIFTMLAEKVIADGGVVFGARFDSHWEVVHDYCDTVAGLAAFRGSKYVQSNMCDCYKQVAAFLKEGRKVLFSGTSCQVAGLHRFLRREYEQLLTVDVVCHGVPSPLVWRKYIEAVKTRPQGVAGKNTVLSSFLNAVPVITGIEFRNKLSGWKKYGFVVRGHADGQETCKNSVLPSGSEEQIIFRESFHENLFMGGFLKNIYLRPSCYACPAKSGKSGSDITLADYWGIAHHHSDMDDDKGTSLVMLHTAKGVCAFRELDCNVQETSYEQALDGNPSIERSVAQPTMRVRFYEKFDKHGIDAIKWSLNKMRPSLLMRVRFKIIHYLKALR